MFVVTVHICGGSQAEATQHRYVLGPFATLAEANKADEDLYTAASQISSYLRNEMVCDIVEVPDQTRTVADAVAYLQRQYGD